MSIACWLEVISEVADEGVMARCVFDLARHTLPSSKVRVWDVFPYHDVPRCVRARLVTAQDLRRSSVKAGCATLDK